MSRLVDFSEQTLVSVAVHLQVTVLLPFRCRSMLRGGHVACCEEPSSELCTCPDRTLSILTSTRRVASPHSRCVLFVHFCICCSCIY